LIPKRCRNQREKALGAAKPSGGLLLRDTLLTAAIRRELLAVLADSDATLTAATAQVAAGWGARRRRCGDSPASVHTAEVIAVLVGAELGNDDRYRAPGRPGKKV
jgi:hypothetical protein